MTRKHYRALLGAQKTAEKILIDHDYGAVLAHQALMKANRFRDLLGDLSTPLVEFLTPLKKSKSNLTDFRGLRRERTLLALGAVLYFINPIDLVPDFIPISGLLDDVAILSIGFGKLKG